jgi:rubrerythrin
VSASGLGALAPGAFADGTPPAGDLAYLRLLIAAELLAVDFYTQALERGDLRRAYGARAQRILVDESEHYTLLAALMTAAGQTPATADIDFSYPGGVLTGPESTLRFARELEQVFVGSYIDALTNVQTPAYRQTMAQILANEARHQSALAGLEGKPPIGNALAKPVPMDVMSDFLDIYES